MDKKHVKGLTKVNWKWIKKNGMTGMERNSFTMMVSYGCSIMDGDEMKSVAQEI